MAKGKKKEISMDDFREFIKSGDKTYYQITQKFGITRASIKSKANDLMQLDKKFYAIIDISSRDDITKYAKNGVHISKKFMAETNFNIGDSFEIKTTKDTITLKKM